MIQMNSKPTLPNGNDNLRSVVLSWESLGAKKLALICDNETVTYGEMFSRVCNVAHSLSGMGVQNGDRVALLLPNSAAFLELFFGVVSIGAIVVPLNTRLHPSEHAKLLTDCKPKLLFVHGAYRDSVSNLRATLPDRRGVIVVDGAELEEEMTYESWRGSTAKNLPDTEISISDFASLLYTSGTTSTPKGVVLSHGNYAADIANVGTQIDVSSDSVNLQLSPLYHAAAVHTLTHLAAGATSILRTKFDPLEVFELIERHKVSYLFAVPTMLYQLMDHPRLKDFDLSSLKMISYGAAAITGVRLEQALKVFGCKLLHAYGMTETTSHASVLRPQEHLVAAGSIGRGLPNCEVRVVNESNTPVAPGEIGEIVVRGNNVMQGYWERQLETDEVIKNGWLQTGDLARVDGRGYIYIVDRKKDMVISGGVNIYPRDVEDVISRHPGVSEVAVYGVPDELWGESLACAVVLVAGQRVEPAALLEYARDHLASFKVPKQIKVVDALPKTATGKVRKVDLRAMHSL